MYGTHAPDTCNATNINNAHIHAQVRWAAVSGALSDSFERKQKHRDALAVVLTAGAKDGALDEAALLKGFGDVLGAVPDVCIDVPQVTDDGAMMVVAGLLLVVVVKMNKRSVSHVVGTCSLSNVKCYRRMLEDLLTPVGGWKMN